MAGRYRDRNPDSTRRNAKPKPATAVRGALPAARSGLTGGRGGLPQTERRSRLGAEARTEVGTR